MGKRNGKRAGLIFLMLLVDSGNRFVNFSISPHQIVGIMKERKKVVMKN